VTSQSARVPVSVYGKPTEEIPPNAPPSKGNPVLLFEEGNGVLDPHEIRVFLRSAGEPEDVISRIVASLDINRDGDVSWQEFLSIVGAQKASR
jgi:hypothetical protein